MNRQKIDENLGQMTSLCAHFTTLWFLVVLHIENGVMPSMRLWLRFIISHTYALTVNATELKSSHLQVEERKRKSKNIEDELFRKTEKNHQSFVIYNCQNILIFFLEKEWMKMKSETKKEKISHRKKWEIKQINVSFLYAIVRIYSRMNRKLCRHFIHLLVSRFHFHSLLIPIWWNDFSLIFLFFFFQFHLLFFGKLKPFFSQASQEWIELGMKRIKKKAN